ncbi:MAG: hypothetical protein M3R00_00915 [Pseudomonadota bacterium]|nr:hypothetical protein [Pseudomonadota bacterium]
MKLKSLYPLKCLSRLGKFFSTASLSEDNNLLKKYPYLIGSERLDQILEESSHKYSCVFKNSASIEKQYPNQVDSDKLEIVLKEAEETRKKFSVY